LAAAALALVLAGRATTAVSPDLPPAPPVWAPVTDLSPAPAQRGSWAVLVGVGPANVRVQVPDAYARTPEAELAFARWASFLGTLLHGDELGSVTLSFALPHDLARQCTAGALACYFPNARLIVAPVTPPAGWPLEHVIAHEYGHHVAASRDNAPWSAFEWGTKRWATVARICERVGRDTADPFGFTWEATPGEAFAETYRLLNARRAGVWAAAPGWVFGNAFPFTTATQRALELDVTQPWRPALNVERSGRIGASGRARVRVTALLDGTVRLRLRGAPRGALLRTSRAIDPAAPGGAAVDATVCGDRTIDVDVVAPQGSRFVLEVHG
jgi:hypothetical protein